MVVEENLKVAEMECKAAADRKRIGGFCGGVNEDHRVLTAQTELLNANDQDVVKNAAVEENVEKAEMKRKATADGKKKGGKKSVKSGMDKSHGSHNMAYEEKSKRWYNCKTC